MTGVLAYVALVVTVAGMPLGFWPDRQNGPRKPADTNPGPSYPSAP